MSTDLAVSFSALALDRLLIERYHCPVESLEVLTYEERCLLEKAIFAYAREQGYRSIETKFDYATYCVVVTLKR